MRFALGQKEPPGGRRRKADTWDFKVSLTRLIGSVKEAKTPHLDGKIMYKSNPVPVTDIIPAE
jgi:hypothetical protein